MCCIIDSLLGDLLALIRQLLTPIRHGLSLPYYISSACKSSSRQRQAGDLYISADQNIAYNQDADHFVATATTTSSSYEYKMMSKKGLLKFVKYTLIFSNAFGFILSIFLGLFGIAYPDKHFPLSYKGREMALCSLFCMLFTTIGYCGAQNHRRMLLIIYGATNVIIVIIVVILWFLFKENSILGNKEISNMFITTLAITIAVMFLFSFVLAFHIQTFKDNTHDSIVSQSHQLLQQTTAFLQQQQQQLVASQNAASLTGGSGAQYSAGINGNQTMAHHHHNIVGPAASDNNQQFVMQSSGGQMANHLGHSHQHQHHHQHQQLQLMPAHHLPPPPPPLSISQMKPTRGKTATGQLVSGAAISAASSAMQLPPPQIHQQTLLPPPLPPQVPPSTSQQAQPSQQLSLIRNQSSPLPARGVSYQQPQQQSTSRAQSGKSGGQSHYQSQKQPQNSNIIQPAPSPPLMHPHSMREHHRMGPSGTGSRMPSCPVQYCTFQCDRTV